MLNQDLLELIKLDSREANERIGKKGFFRWQEENRKPGDILMEGSNNLAYGLMMYHSAMVEMDALSKSAQQWDVKMPSKVTQKGGQEGKGVEERGNNTGSGSWEAQTPRTGEEWNRYFQDTYGAENVKWKARSFEHIIENPQTLYGSSQSEIAKILGDGWTADSYGNSGTGWKFINDAHPDLMVFYHNADGVHGGAYYGFSSGLTGTVKLVGYDYIALPGDNAIILQMR